jgi:hypothetical protein
MFKMVSKGRSLVLASVFLGSSTLACADIVYEFSGGDASFPGTAAFEYTSPSFVTADLSVPASALDSCELSGAIMGPCFAVNFFPSGPDIPTHNPELTFQTAPDGVVGTLFYYFPLGSSFATLGTLTASGNPGSLTISETPEPSSMLLVLSVALLGVVTLHLRGISRQHTRN